MPDDQSKPPTGPPAESEPDLDLDSLLETSGGTPLGSAQDLPPDSSMEFVLEPTAIVLNDAPVADEPVVQPAPAPAPAPQPIRCEFCGTVDENPAGKFCNTCGRRLTRAMPAPAEGTGPAKRCPLCGHLNKLEVRVCANCGQLMRLRNL